MRVVVLYSGGKDSHLALYRLLREGHEIVSLLTVIPEKPDSWMFHRPNVELAGLQADCMGFPWQCVKVSGEKEKEVAELIPALSQLKYQSKIEGVATGAIASNYQKSRVEKLCDTLGLKHLSPLWGTPERELLTEILNLKFEVYFTSVSAEGLDKDWLGKVLDLNRVNTLLKLREKYGLNPSGEGGEYETFVCDSPLFKRRLRVLEAETVWHHNSGIWNIKSIQIVEKIPLDRFGDSDEPPHE
ncbi:MAG: TIGR00289 family protein [Candidatus Methanomethyliaceae archaeon]|nr:TIGR00289 family protein [Candidatus Methanomethyliaceae archaeon]